MPNIEKKIKIYRPTVEEFSDFNRYVQFIESDGGHLGGICKVNMFFTYLHKA